jgi:hypothetical protein
MLSQIKRRRRIDSTQRPQIQARRTRQTATKNRFQLGDPLVKPPIKQLDLCLAGRDVLLLTRTLCRSHRALLSFCLPLLLADPPLIIRPTCHASSPCRHRPPLTLGSHRAVENSVDHWSTLGRHTAGPSALRTNGWVAALVTADTVLLK